MSLPTPFLKVTDAMLSALLPFTIDCGCAQSRAEACFRLAATTVIITEMSVVSGGGSARAALASASGAGGRYFSGLVYSHVTTARMAGTQEFFTGIE